MEQEVQLVGVTKEYEDVIAVQDLTLNVGRGEFVTLLGPSGSGKTTSLLMLAGFVEPTRGQIFLQNRDVTHVPPYKRNIGMVFQNYALFPHMTVEGNVAFPLQMRRVPRRDIEAMVNRALALVQLEGLNQRYPAQLSGGQQQRVALARALVFQPALLLMDEPLGALDKQLRELMQLELKHLQRNLGITVIYVTHDQAEALTMSDRIALMSHGRIEQIGSPSELYDRPANRFVAGFLGESNLIEGTLVEVGATEAAVRTDRGLTLRARSSQLREDRRVTLSLRPEKIRLGNSSSPNSFRGVIKEVIYLGDAIKLRVELPGGHTILVKEQTGQLALVPSEGEAVDVGWGIDDMSVFYDPRNSSD